MIENILPAKRTVSPPLFFENPFSVLGRRRIFLFFSKVIAVGLVECGSGG